MTLRPVEARVLACLVEKETTVPDSYPLTAKAPLAACNQASNRRPITDYDERTISDALDALKAAGLVRFVHPSHGGRTLRYRHVADEKWELERGALGVLAMLVLRGPETEATLRARAERHLRDGGVSIEDALAVLMSGDEPFVCRLARRPGEREARVHQLVADTDTDTGDGVGEAAGVPGVVAHDLDPVAEPQAPCPRGEPAAASAVEDEASASAGADETAELVDALLDEMADLRRRLERLERLIDG